MPKRYGIEPKTSKPELYAKIGLGDPAAADEHSGMVRFELEDNNDKVLTSVVIGQQQEARGGPNLNEYYVLKDDDPQVWLVQGNLPTENEVGDWVDNEVMGIEPQRVCSGDRGASNWGDGSGDSLPSRGLRLPPWSTSLKARRSYRNGRAMTLAGAWLGCSFKT